MLDTIWGDQQGQEVVFQWTEWLHGSALSHLGLAEGVALWGPNDKVLTDYRAISENVVPEQVIPILMGYNEKKCHEAFLSNMHQCEICFSEYLGDLTSLTLNLWNDLFVLGAFLLFALNVQIINLSSFFGWYIYDIEKAYDIVSWDFFFKRLPHYEMCPIQVDQF